MGIAFLFRETLSDLFWRKMHGDVVALFLPRCRFVVAVWLPWRLSHGFISNHGAPRCAGSFDTLGRFFRCFAGTGRKPGVPVTLQALVVPSSGNPLPH